MYTLRLKAKFARKLNQLIAADPALSAKFSGVMSQLQLNPRSPILKSHKVRATDGRLAFSSYVTKDLRILWDYADTSGVLDLLDVGGHSGSRKVYK